MKNHLKSHLANLQDYNVIKEINRGGFGVVYLIENKTSKKQLVAKVNFQNYQISAENKKFLSREISILIRVQGPTIISFSGFSLTDFKGNDNVTILMKYMENGSLKHLIELESQSQSPHEYDNTAKQIILCGIAHGMMTLHSHRVLHRDLKPDNVLIDSNYHPYITDFGLSKFLDPDNSKSQSQAGCGTSTYMSPEVILDIHYSTKSDVYSFGILMFEVITGEKAFNDILINKHFNPYQITTRVVNGERPNFKIPVKASLRQLIERCWSKDPKDRPTFKELFNKLSLTFEKDDDMIESEINGMISDDKETSEEGYSKYCLDGVDYDRLFEYVDTINNHQTTTNNEDLQPIIEEQSKRISTIEDNLRKIQELNQKYQKEIETLKSELNQLKNISQTNFQSNSTNESTNDQPKIKTTSSKSTNRQLTIKTTKEPPKLLKSCENQTSSSDSDIHDAEFY